MRLSHFLLLILWCGVVYLPGIAAGSLYRTESLRAIIGRECLHGHWLFPVLYGEPFLTKPPGHYVAIGLCSLPIGDVTIATARLPSVIAASITMFLMYGLFRRSLNEHIALVAAMLLPTSFLWLDKVPSAEIDMTLVGWVTAAIVAVYHALEVPHWRTSCWIVALGCVALGTMTKWTAPAFFYLTLIPLLVWRRQLGEFFGWRHLLGVGVAIGVFAAWVGALSLQIGHESLVETVQKEAAYRFAPKSAAKGYPWFELVTYPLQVLASSLPLSIFALFTFRRGFAHKWDDGTRRVLQLLHCWVWPNLIFWSLVPNHSIRYVLPLTPGLVGLGVLGLLGTLPTVRVTQRTLLALLQSGLVIKIAFVLIVIPERTLKRNPEPIAAQLREQIPADQLLYLFRLKDEGVLFYYARPARRLRTPNELPPGAYAVLIRQEWEDRGAFGHLQLVYWTQDQQGDPLIVVRSP